MMVRCSVGADGFIHRNPSGPEYPAIVSTGKLECCRFNYTLLMLGSICPFQWMFHFFCLRSKCHIYTLYKWKSSGWIRSIFVEISFEDVNMWPTQCGRLLFFMPQFLKLNRQIFAHQTWHIKELQAWHPKIGVGECSPVPFHFSLPSSFMCHR